MPWIGNGLYLSGLSPIPNLDLTPFAFTLSGVAFAWALFRFRLLDIVPVARRAVIDGMPDGVIVLDGQNRIIDLNLAAQRIIGPAATNAIGQPAAQILAGYADLVDRFRRTMEDRAEISLDQDDGQHHYELEISPLTSQRDQLLGRVVVLHDITARKAAETALRDQKQRFENLVAVARATAEQPTLEGTLQNALNVATNLTQVEAGSLFLLDEQGFVTHHIAAFGKNTPGQEPGYIRQVMDKGLAGWVVRHHQAALVYDTGQDERWLPFPDNYPYPIRSALAVPIISGAGVSGVLTLVHPTPAYFNPEHQQLMQAAADQMALAIRNAQIFEAQRRMADRQITLYEVLHSIAGQADPEQVVRVAVDTITEFAGWPKVLIGLPQQNQTAWTAVAVRGMPAALTGRAFSINRTVAGLALATGQTQLVSETAADQTHAPLGSTTRTVLATPLARGERILGVLSLESDRPAAYDPDDVLLVESLAEAIALTLDNAQLHAETQRRLKEQTALREASVVISSTLDLETVLGHITEQMARAVDVSSNYICSYEPDTRQATVLAEHFSPQAGSKEKISKLNTGYYLPQDFPSLADLLQAGQPIINQVDNPYLADIQRNHMRQFGAQTTLTIPVQVRGETIAYAELRDSRRRRDFSAEEIALCQGIAQQAAIAIEHARLYDETVQHAASLSALYTVTRVVSHALELEEALPQALWATLTSLGFDAGVISLTQPTTNQLYLAAEHGLPPDLSAFYHRQATMPHTLCSYVFNQQEPLTIDHLDREAPIDSSELVVMGFESYIGIPLQHQQQSLGTLSLFARRPHRLSDEELSLLTAIGNQIATAVTNVRLFQTITDQHSHLQALIEANRDGVLLIGMDQKILVANAPILNLLDLPGQATDWTNRPIFDLLADLRRHAPAAVRAAFSEIRRIQQGHEPPGEGEFEIPTRAIHWLNLPVLTGTTPLGRLIVLQDVTEARQLEKMRNDLTHTMVHDLRNPLTAIHSSLHLIEFAEGDFSPQQQWMLDVARNRSEGMLDLVNDILDVSQLESGRMPLERSPVSLENIIEETLQAQTPLAAGKNLDLDSNIPKSLPLPCADARLIERVLQNLVGNAIKFTPEGGQVYIKAHQPDEALLSNQPGFDPVIQISVEDTGPGIPPELQSRLFQKFTTGRQVGSGSGLGLAFCKLAIEAHGGKIWVQSEPNEGTIFNFTLPVNQIKNCQNGSK